MKPTHDDEFIEFPSGAAVAAVSDQRSAEGYNDGAVRWPGDEPVFPGPAMTHADARTLLEGLSADDRARFEAMRGIVRVQEQESHDHGV